MSNEFEFELPNGQKVYTGNQKPETMPLSFVAFPEPAIRPLDDIVEIVKDSRSLEVKSEWDGEVEWFNQGNKSSCNAYMIAWMLCILIWRQTFGKVRLSPEWLYSRINGGQDRGSMLDDGMVECFKNGMPNFNPAFYQRFRPSDFSMEEKRWAADKAKDNRFGECYKAPTDGGLAKLWLALCSCIADGGVAGLAVHVGNKYMNSKTIAGLDKGPGNHAIAGAQLRLLTDRPKSPEDIVIVSPQSWGKRFADRGFTDITMRHLADPMRYHAIYCARSSTASRDQMEECLL